MIFLSSAIIVAAAILFAAYRVTGAVAAAAAREQGDAMALLQLLAPGLAAVDADPRAMLVWEPLARVARALQPDAAAELDRAAGRRFPFSGDQIEAAHARWTAEWLAWERRHDAEFKLKAAAIEEELAASRSPKARAELEALDRAKLDLYQHRYEDYVRVGKALQALIGHV